jgi:primosomal protein N'
MYVLQVVPLSPTAPVASLTYRSTVAFPRGTLVSVPLRKSIVRGVVLESLSVREAKSIIKQATFELKKSDVVALGKLSEELLSHLEAEAVRGGASLGSVLRLLLREQYGTLLGETQSSASEYSVTYCEETLPERFLKYQTYIEETSGVTLLVVPSRVEAVYAKTHFKALKPYVVHAKAGDIPSDVRLIIATPGEAFIPHPLLSLIILERVSAGSYKLLKRPFLDTRAFLQALAKAQHTMLVYGDFPLPLELRPVPERAPNSAHLYKVQIVNPTLEEAQSVFKPLTDSVAHAMRSVLAASGIVVALGSRKGYAPGVVCRDCGMPVVDEFGRRLVFSTRGGVRVLRSADGSLVLSAKRVCDTCGSWNLMPVGLGIEQLEEYCVKQFPEARTVLVDPTKAKSLKEVKVALSEGATILVGTESMLALVPTLFSSGSLSLAVVASMDSLLSVPFWRARERFVRNLLLLRTFAKKTLLTSRKRDDTVLTCANDFVPATFFEEESSLRKALHFPPYGTLVLIECVGSEVRSEQEIKKIAQTLSEYEPLILPSRKVKTGVRNALVLHIRSLKNVDTVMASIYTVLPPYMAVHVDPETFW